VDTATIAAAKDIAAVFNDSSGVLTKCVHPLVDTANEGLLMLDMPRAKRRADA
jgi:divalent metal cation (Fe/Co/Zn/Cd) transporter